jgi:protein SCO1
MKSFVNVFLVLIGLTVLGVGYYLHSNGQQIRELPYYQPIEKGSVDKKDAQGRHLVLDFSLTDQTGKKITRSDFEQHISVVDFFFTRCEGICPRMTSQMQRVYTKYKGNKQVQFISHTVNPENDSTEVLASYASKYQASADQWHFVTGDKPQLYNLARKSYLISDTQGDGGKEDFVHSQNFALIDPAGHIRGVYDGTDTAEVDRLIIELGILLKEKKE